MLDILEIEENQQVVDFLINTYFIYLMVKLPLDINYKF
tara:strand:- start:774 stop:887 length:114 start_codon:yes stop_codon:yes gene_type:complete